MSIEKKPLTSKIKMLMSISTLLIVLFAFNQCVLKPSGKNTKKISTSRLNAPSPGSGDAGDIDSGKTLPPGMDMPPMNTPVTDADLATLEVGVKNFEQINMSMSQLTGVPVSEPSVVTVFNDIAIQLPGDNSVKSFLPSMQVAIAKLATEYCDRTVETDAYRKAIWTSVDFSQGPSVTFITANKIAMINQTVDRFLGPIDTAAMASAKTELLSLYDQLMDGESTTSSLTTKKVVKGICVASLSSAYVTIL